MPNIPVRKDINPLTPITYTVGALLAKQMDGELGIPKEISLLASAPDSSIFIMDNVRSHCELRLNNWLTTPQSESSSAFKKHFRERLVASQPSWVLCTLSQLQQSSVLQTVCKAAWKLQSETANSWMWITSGKDADFANSDKWQSLFINVNLPFYGTAFCFSVEIRLEGSSACVLVNWNTEQ